MSTIRIQQCGCEVGYKCTRTTLCAVEAAVRDQREHDEAEIDAAIARAEAAEHALLLANGTADLAIKHRDAAEARVRELEAALDHYSGGSSEALLRGADQSARTVTTKETNDER